MFSSFSSKTRHQNAQEQEALICFTCLDFLLKIIHHLTNSQISFILFFLVMLVHFHINIVYKGKPLSYMNTRKYQLRIGFMYRSWLVHVEKGLSKVFQSLVNGKK